MWRAARSGMSDDLVDPVEARPVDAWNLIDKLVDHVAVALQTSDDAGVVDAALRDIQNRGTGSDEQRISYAWQGDMRDVVLDAIARTTEYDQPLLLPAPRPPTSPGWPSGSSSTATPWSATTASVIGDPTEAALVVLAAKLGVDAEETRRAYPRLAEVPFDSEYKFMATFHRVTLDGVEHVIELVKGAPDVVIARCSQAGGPLSGSQVPIAQALAGIAEANERMGGKGLRVLAFAARLVADDELATMAADPMSLTQDLSFVGMAGIIDPLRAEAKERGRDRPRRPASTCG